MLDENITVQDLEDEIDDIRINHHKSFLVKLDALGKAISTIEKKEINYVDSTFSLIKELFRQFNSEVLFYFNRKEEDIFRDIILISKQGVKGLSGTSGISSMINNTYDDFNTYLLDISKLLHNIEEVRDFNKDIFINLDELKEKINELSRKDNALLDKLFKIIINSKQKQS